MKLPPELFLSTIARMDDREILSIAEALGPSQVGVDTLKVLRTIKEGYPIHIDLEKPYKVTLDLEFEDLESAEEFHDILREWINDKAQFHMGMELMDNVDTGICDVAAPKEYTEADMPFIWETLQKFNLAPSCDDLSEMSPEERTAMISMFNMIRNVKF